MPNDETGEYTETITGWTDLTGKCAVCGSTQVVMRVESKRQYKLKAHLSGNHSHDYCVKHVPDSVKRDKADWMQYLTTPPGT